MQKANYHSHTFRCKHASGEVWDYVKAAYSGGAEVYGISDHAPIPDGRFPDVRMDLEELQSYELAVNQAREAFPAVKILLGLECEYFSEYRSFHEDELLGRRGYDYLIGAGHYTPLDGSWENSFADMNYPRMLNAYSSYLGEMMETGLYAFIAHPDIFGCSNEVWNEDLTRCSRDILEAAQDTGVPLEINANGLRKKPLCTPYGLRPQYPWPPFWELAAGYDISVVCSSDAHCPEDALAGLEEMHHLARRYNLPLAELSDLGSGSGSLKVAAA